MRSRYVILCLAATSCWACVALGQISSASKKWSEEKSPPGVVVERVKEGSAAKRAGIEPGDIISRWARGPAAGAMESPFDLLAAQSEEAPKGNVTLQGMRDTLTREWLIGPGAWGLEVRPNLWKHRLAIYRQGQRLADARRWNEAAKCWRSLASLGEESYSAPQSLWFLFRTANVLAKARQWKASDAIYQDAVSLAGDRAGIAAQLLSAWGATFQERSDWENAAKYYQQALAGLRASSPNSLTFALGLSNLGFLAASRSDWAGAGEYYRQALGINQKLAPGSLVAASSLKSLGVVAFQIGQLATAKEFSQQALAILEKLDPISPDAARTLNCLAGVALRHDDLEAAEAYYHQVLSIWQQLEPDGLDIARTLDNLGVVELERQDLAKAEEYQSRALALEEKLAPGSLVLAVTLNNRSLVAKDRGDLDEAEKYQLRALAIRERLAPGSLAVAASQHHLAEVLFAQARPAAAAEYLQRSLAIKNKLAPETLEVAVVLADLAEVALSQGDLAKAEDYDRRALAIAQILAPGSLYVADSLQPLGQIAQRRGELAQAQDYFRQALAIREKLTPGTMPHAESLAALASIMQINGQLDEAAELFERVLDALEQQTAQLGGSDETRSRFRGKQISYYKAYIDLLMRQGKPALAFRVAERSRARSLLEILAEARIDIRKGVDPSLLQQERSVQQELDAKSADRVRFAGNQVSADQVTALNHQIADLLVQHQRLEVQIRESSPNYAALTQPQALSADEIQRQFLDPETLLLEYSLGAERSFLWAVSSSSVVAYELPKLEEIDHVARRLYSLLTARNRVVRGETPQQTLARLTNAERECATTAMALSEMVLGPATGQLKKKRVLVVSDGALQYIPFALLPMPPAELIWAGANTTRPTPMIAEHEIVNLPSASVLAILRSSTIGRKRGTKAVAVLADPVFEPQDARVQIERGAPRNGADFGGRQAHRAALPASAPLTLSPRSRLTRSLADVSSDPKGKLRLARLPFTRQEAAAIMAVTPKDESIAALDFRASRKTLVSQELAQYRILHFATHGLLDNEHPELSGLVLSLVDEQGRPIDGFLDLQDIYNLNLGANLIVLSACETGLGKEVQGEGLIGLTRGFMYAGATRVIASSWQVDDLATAELMGRFYRSMAQKGMSPAAALREAQLEMWKQRSWTSPYYWAAFQLQGDWN